ncbi:MAG: hypothetical protein OHK0029_35960 [Armatimonadaceae bacterium]
MKPIQRFLGTVLALCCLSSLAMAGLKEQPKPSQDTVIRIRNAVRQFEIEGGDLGKARPDLILLVERDPTADMVDWLIPALSDNIAYNGLAATFSDALAATESDTKKNFLRYNLARLHLWRARLYSTTRQKEPYLDVAENVVRQFPENLRDPAVWELKGDIALERNNLNEATAAYNRIGSAGGSAAYAQYKMAGAYQKSRRWREAEEAYARAARTETAGGGGGQLYHNIWQGIASLYLEQRQYDKAAEALVRSAKIAPTERDKVSLQTAIARQLLERGNKRGVLEYVRAALKVSPDDPALERLERQASGGN